MFFVTSDIEKRLTIILEVSGADGVSAFGKTPFQGEENEGVDSLQIGPENI